MTQLQKGLFIGLTALFGIAILSYSFCHHFEAEKVTQAIPKPFRFVATQAESLEKLRPPETCSNDPEADYFLNTLLPLVDKEYASLDHEIACTPIDIKFNSNPWMAACWVGGRAPWLRWKLDQTSDKKISPLKNRTVWPTWECHRNDLPENKKLYFSITENLFLICLSETPNDMVSILYSYDQSESGNNP